MPFYTIYDTQYNTYLIIISLRNSSKKPSIKEHKNSKNQNHSNKEKNASQQLFYSLLSLSTPFTENSSSPYYRILINSILRFSFSNFLLLVNFLAFGN
jgi:hypothetical protein